jgi:tetratricopeptide (TPR) repeat protein
VTARLVDVDEGFDLWSETYERRPEDVFTVQAEITQAIAATLRLPLDTTEHPNRPSPSYQAYDAYIAGRYLLEQHRPGTALRALDNLTRATRIDTTFAEAYAELAEAYLRRGDIEALPPRVAVPLAKEAALRALQLDSTLADAHVTLGVIHFGFDRDWRRAEQEFRRAIALDPNSPEGHQQYSRFLLAMGRIDESRDASERALRLSPASPLLTANLGWHYLHARQYDRARETLWRAIEMDSTAWRSHFDLLWWSWPRRILPRPSRGSEFRSTLPPSGQRSRWRWARSMPRRGGWTRPRRSCSSSAEPPRNATSPPI